jgi:hypothetical protein
MLRGFYPIGTEPETNGQTLDPRRKFVRGMHWKYRYRFGSPGKVVVNLDGLSQEKNLAGSTATVDAYAGNSL